MKRLMLLTIPTTMALIMLGAAAYAQRPTTAPGSSSASYNYVVTIRNLTRGQPFSSGVVVTHRPGVTVWRLTRRPSEGIGAIAQDGNADVETASLQGIPGVDDVVETGPIARLGGPQTGMGPPKTYGTFMLHARPGDRISVAVMLICTNDAFTGVDSVSLPQRIGKKTVYLTDAYDAGVEQNTEKFADIVDPCQAAGPVHAPPDGNNDNLPADGNRIFPHPGIVGGRDLTVDHSLAEHAWRNPVAAITIKLVP